MEKEKKQINLFAFAAIYFLIFFVSVAFNDEDPYLRFPKLGPDFSRTIGIDIGIGIVVGLFVVLITWIITKQSNFFQELTQKFRDLLGNLTVSEIFFIAIFSSVAEEFFFRGLVQSKLGIVFASLLFGCLHTGPGKKYLPWTIFALCMGFLLGGLYEWRNDLLVPVVVHFVINFANVYLLQRGKPQDMKVSSN